MSNGETDLPVIFEASTKGGIWNGIVMNRSSEMSRIYNFVLSDATVGIKVIEGSPEIANGTVMNCITGIHVKGSNAFPLLDDLTIYQNKENGIEIVDMAQPIISRCRIAYNNEAGIKVERSQASIFFNEISFNRDGITLNKSVTAIKGNVLLNNQRSAIIAADISKQTLGIGLNYFGNPGNVQAFSSQPGEEGEVIKVMATKRQDNATEDVRVTPYPETLPEEYESIFIVTYSGEIASDAISANTSEEMPSETPEKEPPGSSLNAYIEAVAAIREKNYEKAIPLLEIAKNEPSRASSSNFWLGVCYLETGEVEKAVNSYQTASVLEPEDVNYLLHLGVVLHIAGRKIEAEKIYRDVLKREPGNTQARKFMAVLMQTSSGQKEVE
ncbi:MAG: right-handed parallel beta-helix repeat-containing protein [Desulfobacterales bacterium]|nr:right-handed parallel beta-helix repeat-containing protein [Desulfobacterales bacterium]